MEHLYNWPEDAEERAAIQAEGCDLLHKQEINFDTIPEPDASKSFDEHGPVGTLACSTAIVRRFLGIADDEPIELTAMSGKWPWVYQCASIESHIHALETVERSVPRFSAVYMLLNPIDPAICARYPQNTWVKAENGRAADSNILARRALFVDIDPVRPKGISATNEERQAAFEAASKVRAYLEGHLGKDCIGFGGSGNGFFLLIAIEPVAPSKEQTAQISEFLKLLQSEFGTAQVSIDNSVFNPARLFACPGTAKRKGFSTEDRPHRETSFIAPMNIRRVPLVEVVG